MNRNSALLLSCSPVPLSRRRSRRGITLLEVLISMGVLAVGLLGVAALIPAGRHEIAQGSRLDYAAMVGRASFRDVQVRGFLNPGNAAGTSNWKDANNTDVWRPAGPIGNPAQPFVTSGVASDKIALVIDPLGIFAGGGPPGYGALFPSGAYPTAPHLTRIAPIDVSASGAWEFMDTIFRSSVDLTTEENATNRDLPPEQVIFTQRGSSVIAIPPSQMLLGDNALRRASVGNYSWLATIVSDPTASALSSKVTVSVAVFHKRNLSFAGAGESIARVDWPINTDKTTTGAGIGGAELVFSPILGGAPIRNVRPGQWIMLAGRQVLEVDPEVKLDYFRWYRVVTAERESLGGQNVTLAGADWNPELIGGNAGRNSTTAFIFDNIVAVYEKDLSLEIE